MPSSKRMNLFEDSEDSLLVSEETVPVTKHRYKPEGRKKLKDNISAWLEATKEIRNPAEMFGYDPNDYSVDEWEAYLRKKNNNLNFEQFLRRNRWHLKPDFVDINEENYIKLLKEAAENSHEFLSEDEMKYAEILIRHCADLRREIRKSKEESREIFDAKGKNSPEYNEAKKNIAELNEKLRFCCQFKYASGDLPEINPAALANIRSLVKQNFFKYIENRKYRWEYRLEFMSGVPPFDPMKIGLYRTAVLCGCISPSDIN